MLMLAIAVIALSTAVSAQDVELGEVTYSALDLDGDGLDDSVEVRATVHNAAPVASRGYALAAVLEFQSVQMDLKSSSGRLDPNETIQVTIRVATSTSSPAGTYDVRTVLHAGDLSGEVMGTDATTVDLYPKGEYQVDVEADRVSVEGLENTSVPFAITVHSLSNNPTGIDIQVTPTLGWPYQLEMDTILMDPDSSDIVDLSVLIPKNTPAGTRETLTVEVTASRNRTAFRTMSLSVTVEMQTFMVDLAINVDQVFMASGQTVNIDGQVTNGGNNQDNVTMLVDIPAGWTAVFEPPFILLDRGTTGDVILRLTAPASLTESGSTTVNITARSMGLVQESVFALLVIYNTAELQVDSGNITLSPPTPSAGEEVTIQATIGNAGAVIVHDVVVVVRIGGEEVARTTLDDVPPGGLSVATLRWTPLPGSHLVRVIVDPDGVVAETVEDNNEATLTLVVTSPDLVVTTQDISVDPDYPTEGTEATILVTVFNSATLAAGPFQVVLSVNGEEMETFSVGSGLAAGANVTLEATWNASDGRHEFQVQVDPDGDILEEDVSNNEVSRWFSVNSRPIPTVLIRMDTVEIGEVVGIDASGSSDPDGRVRHYFFDYGDGTDSGWVFNAHMNHTYTQSGSFEVRVYARDEAGAQSLDPAVATVEVKKEQTDDGNNNTPNVPPWVVAVALAVMAFLAMVRRRRSTGLD
jgi:uncharacterized membrane protein